MNKLLLKSQKYKAWKSLVTKNGVQIEQEETLALTLKPKTDEVLFAFQKVKGKNSKGEIIPPYVLLRGHAAVIVPVLVDEYERKHVVMVKQYRNAVGTFIYELPAGMLDEDIKNASFVARKELNEEVGAGFDDVELIPLNKEPVYCSPGLLDEGIYYFYFEKSISLKDIKNMKGRETGCKDEGESIVVDVCPLEESFEKTVSIPSLLGLHWYVRERLINEVRTN